MAQAADHCTPSRPQNRSSDETAGVAQTVLQRHRVAAVEIPIATGAATAARVRTDYRFELKD
jgi:hypothetical protein